MELPIMIAAGAGIALLLWLRSRKQARERHITAMWTLRFHPLSGSSFVDFKEMIYVIETTYVDYPVSYHATRVFNMRRREGPIWEIREERESHNREKARIERSDPGDPATAVRRENLAEAREWGKVEFGAVLEVAYQRFLLHYQELPRLSATPVDLAVERDVNHQAAQMSANPNPRGRRAR